MASAHTPCVFAQALPNPEEPLILRAWAGPSVCAALGPSGSLAPGLAHRWPGSLTSLPSSLGLYTNPDPLVLLLGACSQRQKEKLQNEDVKELWPQKSKWSEAEISMSV